MPSLTLLMHWLMTTATAANVVTFPTEPQSLLQMGAFGLLTVILIWHGRMMTKVIDRALRSFDSIVDTLGAIKQTLTAMELRLDRVEQQVGLARRGELRAVDNPIDPPIK